MLDQLRKELNDIDKEIMLLFAKRFRVTENVGAYKKENNMVILQPEREAEILERLSNDLESSPYKAYIIEIYKCIFTESRKQQHKYIEE